MLSIRDVFRIPQSGETLRPDQYWKRTLLLRPYAIKDLTSEGGMHPFWLMHSSRESRHTFATLSHHLWGQTV